MQGVIAAWYDPLMSRNGLVVAFTGLREFFIWVRSINLIPENMFVVFLFLEGAWSDTFGFDFSGFSAVVPNRLLEGQAHMLLLRFLGDTRHDCLARPGWYLSSIPSASPDLGFCCWRLAPSSLGVLGRDWLACLWPYLARFLSAIRELYWWPLYSPLTPNLFNPSAWGATFCQASILCHLG